MGDHLTGVGDHLSVRAHHGLRAGHIQVRHHADLDASSGTALDFFLVAGQHFKGASADGADAEQTDLDGFHDNEGEGLRC